MTSIEEIKNYWNRQPCNIRHSKKEIGTKEYFDDVEKKKYFVEPHIPKFADFNNWKNKRVLEIGCGIGTDAVNFARNGAEYHGIELSKKSLELTKKRFKIYNLHGRFYNINAEKNMDFLPKNSFDLVYSFGVIHHTINPKKIVKNIFNLLKPGGTLKIMLYATNSWKKFTIDNYDTQYEAQKNCPLAKTYTKEEVSGLLDKFNNIKIEQHHIFPYKIEPYKNNIFIKEDWFENMPSDMFKILEKNLGWHLCITAFK